MRNFVIIFFIIPISSFCQENWTIIGNEEIQFTAKMYNLESSSLDTLWLYEQSLFRYSWLSEDSKGDHPVIKYKVKSTNYPSTYIHSDSSFQLIEEFLNSTINNYIENEEYEYINSGWYSLDGYFGKLFKFKELKSNELYESRVILIENQLIELETLSEATNWFSKSKATFFDSLVLKGRKKNKINYGIGIVDSMTYQVDFPEMSTSINQFIDSEFGILNLDIRILERNESEGNMVFISLESKYPHNFIVTDEELELFYDQYAKGSINGMNGKLISIDEIEIDGMRGVEYYGELFNGLATSYNRIFLVDRTLYSIGLIFTYDDLDNEGKNFIESFRLKNKN
jgi:hypothetical protein